MHENIPFTAKQVENCRDFQDVWKLSWISGVCEPHYLQTESKPIKKSEIISIKSLSFSSGQCGWELGPSTLITLQDLQQHALATSASTCCSPSQLVHQSAPGGTHTHLHSNWHEKTHPASTVYKKVAPILVHLSRLEEIAVSSNTQKQTLKKEY